MNNNFSQSTFISIYLAFYLLNKEHLQQLYFLHIHQQHLLILFTLHYQAALLHAQY